MTAIFTRSRAARFCLRPVRGACEGRKFQESNLATVDNSNLDKDTFGSLLASIDEFFSGLAKRMTKDRFTDRQSLHLTSPGWQVLDVLHHYLVFKLKLDVVDRAKVLEKVARIDWSRFNPDWMTLGIGHPEVDKKNGQPVVDDKGRQRVALTGAGRTNTQKLLDYMREKAGIKGLLASEEIEELAA